MVVKKALLVQGKERRLQKSQHENRKAWAVEGMTNHLRFPKPRKRSAHSKTRCPKTTACTNHASAATQLQLQRWRSGGHEMSTDRVGEIDSQPFAGSESGSAIQEKERDPTSR